MLMMCLFFLQCQASNEEEIHAILSEQSLYPAGWIHVYVQIFLYFIEFNYWFILVNEQTHTSNLPHMATEDSMMRQNLLLYPSLLPI
jgi:hypothetical protein